MVRTCFIILLVTCGATSCVQKYSYYLVGDAENRTQLRELFRYINSRNISEEATLTAHTLIANRILSAGFPQRMRSFFVLHVHNNPTDIYNIYYLYLVAKSYLASENTANRDMALYYLHQVIWNYDDVYFEGTSTHELALRALIEIEVDERRRADFLLEFIDRFATNPAHYYLQLADTYGHIAEWDQAYTYYQKLVDLCIQQPVWCQQLPNNVTVEAVQADVRFWQSSRNWTISNLDQLVQNIKGALLQRSVNSLLQYRPSVNFFARSWQQEEFDFNSQINFNIGIFLRRSQVSVADTIDINSNDQEAYLRTWGWSHRIPTWYFYFRKIEFPADPEVHNTWEWAGIFFGEQI